MRAGFIIRCGDFDNGEIYTNANLTNDVARRYLERFPHKRDMFDVIPEEKPEERPEAPVEAVEEPEQASEQPEKKKAAKAAKKRKK